jgi:polysaccharide pyruvyl transferase WcaK-like protein
MRDMATTRRDFLRSGSAAALGVAALAQGRRPPRILLRSSWQVVNIGDIAHTPGVLALLEKYLPDAEVRLWASPDLSEEVMAMEHRRFPKLRIVKGVIGDDGKASNAELQDAVGWCDFLLHGSGASLVAAKDVAAFLKHAGKPFGVYGITHGSFFTSAEEKDLLSRARFVFFRDSVSLARAREGGVKAPVMEFGPDGAFACDLRDDARATAFLRASNLEEGKFLCCIPRLRYTPYWKIRNQPMTEEQKRRAARNDAMAEHDHTPLREAIAAVVRETSLKVLICPEDVSQMEVGKQWLYDKLPEEVRRRVVWREKFWLTDEALSTYVRSAGLFGLEMHSPIMCVGNGVPAIVCRFEEQTSKGFMWRDIGLGEWLFDFDQEEEIRRLVPAVLALAKDPAAARAKAAQARKFVERRQRETMAVVGANLKTARSSRSA